MNTIMQAGNSATILPAPPGMPSRADHAAKQTAAAAAASRHTGKTATADGLSDTRTRVRH